MIWLSLLAVAAILNASMDTLYHHWGNSIFRKFQQPFWADTNTSWKNKYIDYDPSKGRVKFYGLNMHPAFTDGWHFCKSLMIIFISLSIVTYEPIIHPFYDVIIAGTVWNVTFSLFYDRIFINKK